MNISIIIPTRNEEANIESTLAHLRRTTLTNSIEIIVADASSSDGTMAIANKFADKVISVKQAGRGRQLHEGALASRGDLLLFLHADTRLPENWESVLRSAWQSKNPPAGTAFQLKFSQDTYIYRFIAWGARVRSWITGIPHGDQGIAVAREVYFCVGGFPPVPLMEEYYLGRKLLQTGEIRTLPETIVASTRRYENNGPLFNAFRTAFLIFLYYLGASPAYLARLYDATPNRTLIKSRGAEVLKKIFFATALFSAVSSAYAFDSSHVLWSQALQQHNREGLVNYGALKSQPVGLNNYLQTLAALSSEEYGSWKDEDKIAFWINAYNALTWKAIIDHYPINSSFFKSVLYPKNSIRQINGVWDQLTFNVMGQNLTLEHIEHQILRRDFNEPKIHMALVCAALGCPPLREEAFTGVKLDRQLNDQSRLFLSDPEKFRIDRNSKTVYLSPIFDWFGEDFIKKHTPLSGFEDKSAKEKAVLNFISGYLNPEDQTYLKAGRYSVKFLKYDWTLNELHG